METLDKPRGRDVSETNYDGNSLIYGAVLSFTSVFADEAQFGSVKTTDIDPKGGAQFDNSLTYRFQKLTDNGGSFDLLVEEAEFEYGVTDQFQLGFSAKWDWTQAYHNGPFGTTTPPEPFTYDVPGSDDHYASKKIISFSLDGIYRFLSPYTDGIGLAINLEPEMSPYFGDGFFAEPTIRLILQKNFLDDTLITAFNFTYAPELRQLPANYGGVPGPAILNEETDVNYYFGASYRFIPDWSVGFELLHEQEYNSYDFTQQTNGGTYLGPSIHYGGENFFLTFLFVQQMPWAVAHEAIRAWAKGKRALGMAEVRKLSLGSHAAAHKTKTDAARFAARAAGQAVATWHVSTHAMAVPYYVCKAMSAGKNKRPKIRAEGTRV